MASKVTRKVKYEASILFKSDLSEKNLNKILEQVEETIKNMGGEISSVSDTAQKKLCFRISGFKDAYFVSFTFIAPSDIPSSLKRSLSIMEEVLRFIIIKKETVSE